MATELATETESVPHAIKPVRRHRAMWVLGATFTLVVATTACWACGGLAALRAIYIETRGHALFVDSTTKSFGVVNEGDPASVMFSLTNRGAEPVRVVGCMKYCNCIITDDLPFVLSPDETRKFKVSVRTYIRKVGSPSELINQPVTLFTTSPLQAEIHLAIKGEIRSSARPEGSG